MRTAQRLGLYWEVFLLAGWAPVLVFAVHVFLGRVAKAYDTYPDTDLPMHFIGGAAMAFFVGRCLAIEFMPAIRPDRRKAIHATLIVSLTATVTVVWEFGEWLSDRFLGSRTQGGVGETLLDMLLGIAGGAGFVAVAWRTRLIGTELRSRYLPRAHSPEPPP